MQFRTTFSFFAVAGLFLAGCGSAVKDELAKFQCKSADFSRIHGKIGATMKNDYASKDSDGFVFGTLQKFNLKIDQTCAAPLKKQCGLGNAADPINSKRLFGPINDFGAYGHSESYPVTVSDGLGKITETRYRFSVSVAANAYLATMACYIKNAP